MTEPEDGVPDLRRLADDALELELRGLIANGARTEALVVAHLGEVDARRLHSRAGYRSLFEYCVTALGLSEFESIFRISAARTVRNFPLAFELLERGEIHLSALHLLRHYLTPANHVELLNEARLKSKRQVAALIAARFPRPDVPTNVRPHATEPLSPERVRLELTVSSAFMEKLERIRDRLSHAIPTMDLEAVLDRALDALDARLNKGRFGKPKESSDPPPAPAAPTVTKEQPRGGARRHIPWELSRAVAERDGHRCSYVSPDGRRCSSRGFLQVHHETPWARGGAETFDNLRLLCGEHNLLLAAQQFGEDLIQSKMHKAPPEPPPPRPDKVTEPAA